jgi:hypothetical protein
MTFKEHIGFWLVPAVVGALTLFLRSTAKPTAKVVGAKYVLSYGWGPKAIGYLFVGGWLAAATKAYLTLKDGDAAFVAVLFVCMAIGSSVLLFEAHFVRIEYDADFIYCFSPYRRNRVIPWSSISKVTYSESMRWYILRTRNEGKIRVPIYLSGLKNLLSVLEKHGYKNAA